MQEHRVRAELKGNSRGEPRGAAPAASSDIIRAYGCTHGCLAGRPAADGGAAGGCLTLDRPELLVRRTWVVGEKPSASFIGALRHRLRTPDPVTTSRRWRESRGRRRGCRASPGPSGGVAGGRWSSSSPSSRRRSRNPRTPESNLPAAIFRASRPSRCGAGRLPDPTSQLPTATAPPARPRPLGTT